MNKSNINGLRLGNGGKKAGVMLSALLGVSLFSSIVTSAAPLVKAETPWSKPTYVYGSGLNDTKIKETAKLLGVDGKEVLKMVVDGEDIKEYINGSSSNSGMISSVVVEKGQEKLGVVVSIVTPDKITDINEIQYANAAITAGVKGVRIKVGSVAKVTGESALTGVYKAMDANGVTLKKDRMEVAQKEIETVNEISKELKGEKKSNQKSFDQVIINIKNELNIYYNNLPSDKKVTLEDIRKIVEKAVKDNGLDKVVTQSQIEKLTSLFEKYAKTDAINSQEVINQLKDLSSNLLSKAQEIYKNAEASGLLEKIGQFFKNIINSIMALFK